MKLVRALHGFKKSGASRTKIFKDHIVDKLEFTLRVVDPDMYYRRNVKADGTECYELLVVYVDNVLACSHYLKG